MFLLRSLLLDTITDREAQTNVGKLDALREYFANFFENCLKTYIVGEIDYGR